MQPPPCLPGGTTATGRLDRETQTLPYAPGAARQAEAAVEPCFRPGDVLLERFQVVQLVACGGMGEVYEVQDSALGTRVALKTLRPSALGHASALAQFRRELLLARRVTHPNVCRLFEFFISRDAGPSPLVFLTMELLEGPTLSEYLAREGKVGEEALPLIRQMVAALSAAHRAGVVHRDFKSSNVMLVRASDGTRRAVVTDFGLACGIRPGEGLDWAPHCGMVGSPLYMAPEQVRGAPVTPATDVYALGVVLYEMATGTLPFVGNSLMESALQRLRQAPEAPSRRRPGLSPCWEAAILRCLEVDPARRFARVEDVLAVLGNGPVVPRKRPGGLRRLATGLWLAASVAGSVGDACFLWPSNGHPAAERAR